MKKAIIISPNFPPINKISSLRPYYLALELSKDNWDVTVIAESPCKPLPNLSLERPEKNLHTIRINSKNRILWFALASIKIITHTLKKGSPDLIVSTYGPSSSHILGLLAKTLSNKNSIWVADYRDLWTSGNYYTNKNDNLTHKFKSILEKIILAPSDFITTVSQGLKNNLAAFHKKETHVIYNGFEPAELTLNQNPPKSIKTTICYTGTIYKERSPKPLLEAISKTPGLKEKIDIVIAGEIESETRSALEKYKETTSINILGKVSREESYAIQKNSDFCLVVEDYEATKKGVLTGKIFEYISAGKPIIALGVANDSEMAEIIRKSGLMAFCGDSSLALMNFLSSIKEKSFPTTTRDIEFIKTLSRTEQSKLFISKINQYIKNEK